MNYDLIVVDVGEVILGDHHIYHRSGVQDPVPALCLVLAPPVKMSTAITPLENHFRQYTHRCSVGSRVGILEFSKIGIKNVELREVL